MKIVLCIILSLGLKAELFNKGYPDKGVRDSKTDGFYDPDYNYAYFPARVTDRNKLNSILKVYYENENVKYFKSGDRVTFKIPLNRLEERHYCEGFVRGVEKKYVILYVPDIDHCLDKDDYFRRGTKLDFYSETLALRTFESSRFRQTLIDRRKDFLKQLNEINNYLWSFEAQRAKKASEFDLKILQLEKEKERFLDLMLLEKNDRVKIQKELTEQLRQIDEGLDFYRVTKYELLEDRWEQDHEAVGEMKHRPVPVKEKSPSRGSSRWSKNNKFY